MSLARHKLREGRIIRTGIGLCAFLLLLAAAIPNAHPVHGASADADELAPSSPQFYTARVQPILQANCYRCHAGLNHRGGLVLDTRAGMQRGGDDGTVLVPGHPEQSLLVKLIRHEGPKDDPMPMPPKGKISDSDIATVEQWVRAGAAMPPDAAPR